MPFVRQKYYDQAIQKVRIEFGDLVGLEKKEEAYVILKELPTKETLELQKANEKGQEETLDFFKMILPKIIVEHNLYETEKELMSNEAVVDFIYEKLDLTSTIISEYSHASFFTRTIKEESK